MNFVCEQSQPIIKPIEFHFHLPLNNLKTGKKQSPFRLQLTWNNEARMQKAKKSFSPVQFTQCIYKKKKENGWPNSINNGIGRINCDVFELRTWTSFDPQYGLIVMSSVLPNGVNSNTFLDNARHQSNCLPICFHNLDLLARNWKSSLQPSKTFCNSITDHTYTTLFSLVEHANHHVIKTAQATCSLTIREDLSKEHYQCHW